MLKNLFTFQRTIIKAAISTLVLCLSITSIAQTKYNLKYNLDSAKEFYSKAGNEYAIDFDAIHLTNYSSLDELQNLPEYQKRNIEQYNIRTSIKYLFGPMTYRHLGGEQKGAKITVKWEAAYVQDGKVILPYHYSGVWLLRSQITPTSKFELPLPLNTEVLRTKNWKKCTDKDPEHQTWSFFWYFWEPKRFGCDHKLGEQFQMIQPVLSNMTTQTEVTYPEYKLMLADNHMTMTFGFGYVVDPENPQPFKDYDQGMGEFRAFIDSVRSSLQAVSATESKILEKEYNGSLVDERQIGTRFTYSKDGISYEIKIVAAASIDQMEVFAKSFAHDHDDYFGWFGHSRVGGGFDAMAFGQIVNGNPEFYSISSQYQLVYWAGCNSYSYYTKPFFDFKANLIAGDVTGTQGLDIISNTLPSYFSLNAVNAEVLLHALLTASEHQTSYQAIVDALEDQSNASGATVLVNVLGDEDNQLKPE